VKALRATALALLFALLLGFAVGTLIRLQAERPTYYIVS
jgi:hypothetical protein